VSQKIDLSYRITFRASHRNRFRRHNLPSFHCFALHYCPTVSQKTIQSNNHRHKGRAKEGKKEIKKKQRKKERKKERTKETKKRNEKKESKKYINTERK
jgi:hypothetical protein